MKTTKQIADEIMLTLKKAGLTPDQMLEVIRLAKEKYLKLKQNDTNSPRI